MKQSALRRRIVIVSPALADANNGNWQTARRWSGFLAAHHQVDVVRQWDGTAADAMIALHARRSADSIAAFAGRGGPVALVLTGTDIYRDIHVDAGAAASLRHASVLVGLQADALAQLPPDLQAGALVIVQSARRLAARPPRRRSFDLLLVGHLRSEKDPMTAVRALARLPQPDFRLVHIGDARDPDLGRQFEQAAIADPRIQRLGALPHAGTRRRIAGGRLLLLPSVMEGGANVLIEAVMSGVPVLASRIGGSIGLLGADYPGYFEVGNDSQLAALISRCRDDPGFLLSLARHCAARAPAFEPARERDAVRQLAARLTA